MALLLEKLAACLAARHAPQEPLNRLRKQLYNWAGHIRLCAS